MIENGIAVIAPGGTALLIGVDCATGTLVWQTPNPGNWQMSHASVMPMTYQGRKMYVYAGIGGVFGVAAEGNDVGQVLWETTEFAPSVVAPSPLVLDNGRIFITAGYGAGSIRKNLKIGNQEASPSVKKGRKNGKLLTGEPVSRKVFSSG